MARMIPAVIDQETGSPGERTVFTRLRDDPGTTDWYVLHSLALPRHVRQVEGEVDFVVLVPGLGVLCLEVKAHRHVARRDDGMWCLGNQDPTPRSPFRQSADGMHSLRRALIERAPALRPVPFASAVIFTGTDFDVSRPEEWHEWQALDARDLLARPIGESLARVLRAARRHYESAGAGWLRPDAATPTAEQCEVAVKVLRPNFEVVESRRTTRQRQEQELIRLTEEQYDALDMAAREPRAIFEGAAGTGKTLLALEAARRELAAGRRVLLCCYNRALGDWLREQISHDELTVGTLHSYLVEVAKTKPEPNASASFWTHELPSLAVEHLLSAEGDAAFDVLIVDEAQDILQDEYLDVIDLSLHGGLAGGRWLLFGDFERQAIYGQEFDQSLIAKRAPTYATLVLTVNCRNTPAIAEYVRALAGLNMHGRVKRPDNGQKPRLHFYSSRTKRGQVLAQVFDRLRADKVEPLDVVILTRWPDDDPLAELDDGDRWRHRFSPLKRPQRNHGRVSTIHAFKGLEAPVVIVYGIAEVDDEESQALLYVALSRAVERLHILVDERVRRRVARIVEKALLTEAGDA